MFPSWADPLNMLDDYDFDDTPPTWPTPRMGLLKVEDKHEALFITASWTLTATVNGSVIVRSKPSDKAHSEPFTKRWTRQMIRTHQEQLRQLGVDVPGEYVKWGGDLEDLKP